VAIQILVKRHLYVTLSMILIIKLWTFIMMTFDTRSSMMTFNVDFNNRVHLSIIVKLWIRRMKIPIDTPFPTNVSILNFCTYNQQPDQHSKMFNQKYVFHHFYNISYIISRIYHGMTLMPLFCSIPLMI